MSKLPSSDVALTPVGVTKVKASIVTEPIEDVVLTPVNSAVINCAATTLPTLEVVLKPDNSTEYSTPQPELPHVCLPQPSIFDAVTEPIAVVSPDGAVKTTLEFRSRFGEPTEDVVD